MISYAQSPGRSSSRSRRASTVPAARNATPKQIPKVWRVIGPRSISGCIRTRRLFRPLTQHRAKYRVEGLMAALRRMLAAVALVLLVLPGTAWATTVSNPNGVVQVGGTQGPNGVGVTVSGQTLRISDPSNITGDGSGGCVNDTSAQTPTVMCPLAGVNSLNVQLEGGNDTYNSSSALPATIMGAGGLDEIHGGPGPDHVVGGTEGGDPETDANILDGGGGDDMIEGASGPEKITGGAGADRLFGGAGADSVDGGDGNDMVDGGSGNDTVAGGSGDDTLDPGDGPEGGSADSDLLDGGADADQLSYGARTTPVNVTLDDVANDGVAGENDDVRTTVESVTGGTAGDTMGGSAGANTLNGGPGNDQMAGNGGDDAIDGGGDDDTADGGDGNDSVSGGAGSDTVAGGRGDDVVNGSVAGLVGIDGGDQVSGGDGNDAMAGGDGDDTFDGGPGADAMSGGPGTDTASYENPVAVGRVHAAGAPVVVSLNVTLDANPNDGLANEGDNVGTDVENLQSGGTNDTFTGNAGANRFVSAGGEDYLDGGGGSDSMFGGGSADIIRTRDGTADTVDCGSRSDMAIIDPIDTTTGCEILDKGGRLRPRLAKRFVLRKTKRRPRFGIPRMRRTVPLKESLLLPNGSHL